jgi:ribonuclease HI
MTPPPGQTGQILVYADGSCLGNPGPGGWGVVVLQKGGARDYSGGDSHTTNNRMEITAVIEALRRVPAGSRVIVRTDSQYVVNTINAHWKRKANVDLWQELDADIARHNVRFEWVRGHAGHPMNERADRLALEAAKAAADARRTGRRASVNRVGPVSAPAIDPAAEPTLSTAAAPAAPPATAPPAAAPPVAAPSAAAPPESDEQTLEAVQPFLNAGESVRQCARCGGKFIAPERYKDSYCALVACQLERRSRRAQPTQSN